MDANTPAGAFDFAGFRALRLADSHVGEPAARRILSKPYPGVPDRIRDWEQKGRLTVDAEPFVYVHEYTSHGVIVRGLVGTVELASSRHRIHPHESVDASQVEQLIDRMQTTALNPAPLLLIHHGPQDVRDVLGAVTTSPPDFVYTDRADQLHRLWQIGAGEPQAVIIDALRDAHLVIADGHHRFAAAHELQSRHPGTDWDQTLVMVIDQHDTPLQLGAVHRTIARLDLDTVARTADVVDATWQLTDSSHRALARLDRALVFHDGTRWGVLEPRRAHGLLVSWLHDELLPAWGVEPMAVRHHHSASSAMARAATATSVLLPAPSFSDVAASARSGHLLPEKATSFQPKPHAGVLMRKIHA